MRQKLYGTVGTLLIGITINWQKISSVEESGRNAKKYGEWHKNSNKECKGTVNLSFPRGKPSNFAQENIQNLAKFCEENFIRPWILLRIA